MALPSGEAKPYARSTPRNVPVSAAATCSPICSTGPEIAPIVTTMPSTAATMPMPGSESPTLLQRPPPSASLLVMHVDLAVEQHLEIVRRHAAHEHQPQRVAQVDHGVVLCEHRRVLLEERALVGTLDVRSIATRPSRRRSGTARRASSGTRGRGRREWGRLEDRGSFVRALRMGNGVEMRIVPSAVPPTTTNSEIWTRAVVAPGDRETADDRPDDDDKANQGDHSRSPSRRTGAGQSPTSLMGVSAGGFGAWRGRGRPTYSGGDVLETNEGGALSAPTQPPPGQ